MNQYKELTKNFSEIPERDLIGFKDVIERITANPHFVYMDDLFNEAEVPYEKRLEVIAQGLKKYEQQREL